MTALAESATPADRAAPTAPVVGRSGRGLGVGLMLFSAGSNQTGAALGAHAFPVLGPVGVVAVRQLVAACVLLPLARPAMRRMTWAQWWPCLVLAVVFATMNLSLYTAIDRVGLGLAVTLEFLGPLTVALLGSRGLRDVIVAIVAAGGVYVLVMPGGSTDLFGVGLSLLAAACWGCYIVTNRVAGQRLPGLQAPAVASLLTAVGYLPVLIILGLDGLLTGWPLLFALGAGVLSSAVPYAVDLTALRFVPQRLFGVFMSVNPVFAALAGLLILGQHLAIHEWVGIAIVVAANVTTTLQQSRAQA